MDNMAEREKFTATYFHTYAGRTGEQQICMRCSLHIDHKGLPDPDYYSHTQYMHLSNLGMPSERCGHVKPIAKASFDPRSDPPRPGVWVSSYDDLQARFLRLQKHYHELHDKMIGVI